MGRVATDELRACRASGEPRKACMTGGMVQLPGVGEVTLLCVRNSVITFVTGRDLNVKSWDVV